MEYGFSMPTRGPMANPDSLVELAVRGEQLRFGIISVSDHIVIPRSIDSRYPYSDSGVFPGGEEVGECLEQLTVLSFIAGRTSSARLLTSVMVLPYRSPVFAAKILASIDVLSRGRLVLGCGVGWMREEFEALESPPYDERGAVSDEYIRAFKELWSAENPSFEGKYCRFSDIMFYPKPVQKPHPPIWIGGESPPALRRAGRYADAWYPIGNNPAFPVDTPERVAEYAGRVRGQAEKAGRDPSNIQIAYSSPWYRVGEPVSNPDGGRRIFTGSAAQIAEDIRTFEGIGVSSLLLNFQADTLSETVERLDRFASDIRPLADG